MRLGVAGLPPLSKLAGISFIAYHQALLPAYRQYAFRLRSLHARSRGPDSVLEELISVEARHTSPVSRGP